MTSEAAGLAALLGLVMGTALTLLGLSLVMAATVVALVEIDAGRSIGAVDAYRIAAAKLAAPRCDHALRRRVGGADGDDRLDPVAIWLAMRSSLLAPVVES